MFSLPFFVTVSRTASARLVSGQRAKYGAPVGVATPRHRLSKPTNERKYTHSPPTFSAGRRLTPNPDSDVGGRKAVRQLVAAGESDPFFNVIVFYIFDTLVLNSGYFLFFGPLQCLSWKEVFLVLDLVLQMLLTFIRYHHLLPHMMAVIPSRTSFRNYRKQPTLVLGQTSSLLKWQN